MTLRAFVRECGLMFDPQLEIGATELTEMLAAWCKEEGRKAPKGVSEWLDENDCTKTQRRETMPDGKQTRPRYWEGLGFGKPEATTVSEDEKDQDEWEEYLRDEREGLQKE